MSAVSCNLIMEKLDASGISIMSQKSLNSELGICRNGAGAVCMQVKVILTVNPPFFKEKKKF